MKLSLSLCLSLSLQAKWMADQFTISVYDMHVQSRSRLGLTIQKGTRVLISLI